MTRKLIIDKDSLVSFLKATHNDLLSTNLALHANNEKLITEAIKTVRHRVERLRHVLNAIEAGDDLSQGEGE